MITITAILALAAATNTNAGTQDAMITQQAQTKTAELKAAAPDTAAETIAATAGETKAMAPDPQPNDETPKETNPWIFTLAGLLLGAYELAVRFVPTVGNYSMLAWIFKFVEMVLPNLKKGGGFHK